MYGKGDGVEVYRVLGKLEDLLCQDPELFLLNQMVLKCVYGGEYTGSTSSSSSSGKANLTFYVLNPHTNTKGEKVVDIKYAINFELESN